MATVADFLKTAGAQTNSGGYAWWDPTKGDFITDPNVYANTANSRYGGKTPSQYLTGLGVNPNDMNAAVPDPLKGSLMPTGNDLAGMMLALAPIGAMVGGAAGVGGLSNAGFGAAEAGAGAGASAGWDGIAGGGGLGAEVGATPGWEEALGNSWENAAAESSIQNSAMQTANSFGGPTASGWSQGKTAFDALKTILDNGGSVEDWLRVAGAAAPGLIGAYASNQQTDALKQMAQKYQEFGAPYRQRLSDLYANPSAFLSSPEVQVPVQQGTDAMARSLSAKVGNPIDNPGAMSDITNYASGQLFGRLGQEKDRLAGFGGLSSYNQAAPGLEASAIGSGANFWNALGSAASNVFSPPSTLDQLLKGLQGNNIFKVT